MRLAVALGERDPDAVDFYSGPEDQVADIRRNPPRVETISQSATAQGDGLAGLPEEVGEDRQRKRFLLGQIRAIAARADLLSRAGRSDFVESFNKETQDLFGVHLEPAALAPLEPIRRELTKLLPGGGRLVDRYAAFQQTFLIPPERLPAVMSKALELCREQTRTHIQLPPGETVRLEYVRDKPWSAFSRYKGHFESEIQVNADLALTVDRALQLACHEGYPGHHVFNSLTERQMVQTRHYDEWTVQPTFSPQSYMSEALATAAGELAFSDTERLRIERDVLFPLAGLLTGDVENYLRIEHLVDALHPAELSIARDYLDGKLEFARAAASLEDQVLMAHTEATLRYLNEYRTYVVTYTEGRDRVMDWVNKHPSGSSDLQNKWVPFVELIRTPGILLEP